MSSHALLQTAQTPLADGQSTDDQHVGDRHYRGPVISFGFGGVLVSTGSRSCSLYPSTGVGAVVVDKTAVFAKESYYLKQLEEFPGPFPTNTMDHFGVRNATSTLKTYVANRMAKSKSAGESKECRLLWSILDLRLRFNGVSLASAWDPRFVTEAKDILSSYAARESLENCAPAVLTENEGNAPPYPAKVAKKADEVPPSGLSSDANPPADSEEEKQPEDAKQAAAADDASTGDDSHPAGESVDDAKQATAVENGAASKTDLIGQLEILISKEAGSEALDFAIEHCLWSHAILLSQSLGGTEYFQVVQKFASATLEKNGVLKAFYLSKSSVASSSLENLSGWAAKLLAVLQGEYSNESISRIGLLGDTLWKQSVAEENADSADSLCFAAHICYVLINRALDDGSGPISKYLLVGANHALRPSGFATIDSLQRTEIVEYLAMLGAHRSAKSISFANFQSYKLMYSMHLADAGKTRKAKQYVKLLKDSSLSSRTSERLKVLEDALEGGKTGLFSGEQSAATATPRRMSFERKEPLAPEQPRQANGAIVQPDHQHQYQHSQGQLPGQYQQPKGRPSSLAGLRISVRYSTSLSRALNILSRGPVNHSL